MLFSTEGHWFYGKNQIMETVCQLRFPTILSIDATSPTEFQEIIRETFPKYAVRKERPAPKVIMLPGSQPRVETLPAVSNYTFTTSDGSYRMNLTQSFIALTATRYEKWREFAGMLDRPLTEFIRIYEPSCFERVGLRYINAFSKKELNLEDARWRDLIKAPYLGVLADESVNERGFQRCTQDFEMALPGGCKLKLHAGPGMIQRAGTATDQEARYILDLDLSMTGDLKISYAAAALNTLHLNANSVFRGAITDTLHEAMEPERL